MNEKNCLNTSVLDIGFQGTMPAHNKGGARDCPSWKAPSRDFKNPYICNNKVKKLDK